MKKIIISLAAFLIFCLFVNAQTPADSATVVDFKWTEMSLGKGIVNKQGSIPNLYGGTQNVNIMVIDLKSANYKVGVVFPDTCNITSVMAKANHAVAAINGSYYDEQTFESTCYYRVDGKTVSYTTDKEFGRVNGALRIRKGKVDIIPWSKEIEKSYNEKKGIVLSSGPMMVYDNKVSDFSWLTYPRFTDVKHPRSAMAIAKDNKLWLITVDGRFKGKADGMTIPELAHMLKVLGCKKALNLDGGRSTTLWSNAAPENGVLNKPAANKIFDSYGERYNCNTIIIYK
ncbi:MAG: phosphodiester glycosidase family protein [Paludibacter sp.]|nr:phosphodiester glycosidase family protein [Paludibacter sp.]